jgi:thiol-disulfide isomerase/thioredoxin
MSFLKKCPDDYFSFWYFIHQIAQPGSILSKDTAYLKEQLAYVKAVFPAKFTTSIEGKELIKSYETALNPLKIAETAPAFTLTTVDGKSISLKSLKGKYVLLDFWATWCPPCMAEMPFIKEIRKNYPPEKLEIIGLSADIDLKPLNAAVKRIGMNWPQFYDRQKYMSKLYGINAFPTLILIDPEGKIIYKSDYKQNDDVGLPKVLAGIN